MSLLALLALEDDQRHAVVSGRPPGAPADRAWPLARARPRPAAWGSLAATEGRWRSSSGSETTPHHR